jgi:hypothetical protein
MLISTRVLTRRIGDSGSFEQDVHAYVRQITKQEAQGGGFLKRVVLDANNKYVLEGTEKVVGTKDADELDMDGIEV